LAARLETQLVAKAVEIELLRRASRTRSRLVSRRSNWLERSQREKQPAEQPLKEKYKTQIKDRDDAIERLRDMYARLSTKVVGETLEQHCETVTTLSEMKRRAIRPRPTGKMGAFVASSVRNCARDGSKR
jgi:thiamine pyrophosphate-dependent acetolactate synthase large subunit-like protein